VSVKGINVTLGTVDASGLKGAGGSVTVVAGGQVTANKILATGGAGGGTVYVKGNSGISVGLIDVSDPPLGGAGLLSLISSGPISVGSLFGHSQYGSGGILFVSAPSFTSTG